MFTRRLLNAVALAAALAVPTVSFAAAPNAPHAPCILDGHHVISVAPYQLQERERAGRNTVQRLAGAELFVQAEPGLTAEWLQLTLTRHLAAMHGQVGMRDCAFDIDNVLVEVSSAGPGFFVRLIAPDAKAGQEVLRRAQLLVS